MPSEGRILEIGCGHGLFSVLLALQSDARDILGTDVDGAKIRAAQRAATRGHLRVAFEAIAPGSGLPGGPWDAIAIVDVLYLLDRQAQEQLLRAAAKALAPGGALVVKEMAMAPGWKFRWMRAQEQLSVRVLRITAGKQLTFVPPAHMAGWLVDEGLAVDERPLHRGRLHPHHLVVGRRLSP